MNAIELEVQRANTAAFISADSVLLDIYRETFASDGAGGRRKTADDPLLVASGFYRLIPQRDTVVTSTNGDLVQVEYVLMAPTGTDLQREDYFDMAGHRWRLNLTDSGPAYEVKAEIYRSEVLPTDG